MAVWLVVNATVWVYLTYALAWTGHSDIVEGLSRAVVVTILGTFVTYSVSSTAEHISESKRGSISAGGAQSSNTQTQTAKDTASPAEADGNDAV